MKRSFQNRSIEALEDKRMMAANLIGSGMAGMAAAPVAANSVQTSGSTAGAAAAGAVTGSANQSASGVTHLSGLLSGTGQGIVNLVSKVVNGATSANLSVHVSGAPVNATLDVSIGGSVVGSISTNAQGSGVLHLNSALGNADQLLSVLSGLSANANVTIGVAGQTPILSGTLQVGGHGGLNGGSVSDTVAGLTQAINTLENGVISKLNSIIDNLNGDTGNVGSALAGVTNRINHIVDRLASIVGRLTPSAVDSVLGNMDVSSILGDAYRFVPTDVTDRI